MLVAAACAMVPKPTSAIAGSDSATQGLRLNMSNPKPATALPTSATRCRWRLPWCTANPMAAAMAPKPAADSNQPTSSGCGPKTCATAAGIRKV